MNTHGNAEQCEKRLTRAVLVAVCAACMATAATAQTPAHDSPPCKSGSKKAACQGPAQTPSPTADGTATPAASAFPFPTEDSKRGGERSGNEPANPANNLPAMPTSGVPDPPASSERPMALPPDADSSSSNGDGAPTGSSSSRDASDDNVAPTAAPSDAPIKSSALKDLGSRGDSSAARQKLEQTRIADDLKVGGFYMKDGNIQGAYLRFKDAADHDPEDPDVRFSLAEASARLNKRDEALLNYREYLRLDPGGDHEKASQKALSKLGGSTGK